MLVLQKWYACYINCVVAPLSHLCSLYSLFSLPLALLSKHQLCPMTAVELLGWALDPVACSHPAWGIYRCHTRLVVELSPLEPSQTRDVCLGLAACVCALLFIRRCSRGIAVRVCGQGFYLTFVLSEVKKAAWEIISLRALLPTSLLKFFPASRQKTSA